jgi:hypothetical protein
VRRDNEEKLEELGDFDDDWAHVTQKIVSVNDPGVIAPSPSVLPAVLDRGFAGPCELIATDHQDETDQRSVVGVAEVLGHHHNCLNSEYWCWRAERTGMGKR